VDILSFLKADGIILTGITANEYAGPCPFCGTGKDRFRVWPHHMSRGGASGGRYWCRQCGKNGDLIQYLRERRGLSFKEACETIGRAEYRPQNVRRLRDGRRTVWKPTEAVIPPESWQARARAFQIEAAERLLTQKTPERTFLWSRGLKDETIKAASLGWNPIDLYFDRHAWGLDHETKPDGKPKHLWIPEGLVIPAINGKAIIRLRIRRPHGDPRYIILPGSSTTPITAGKETGVAVIVESELDALLLYQEAGDIALMIALGSVAKRPDQGIHARLKLAQIILNALDFDEAGAKEAWGFWVKTYGQKVKRWPVPSGKDPGEAYQAGIDLREWIKAGLEDFI
jgi:DNA primase